MLRLQTQKLLHDTLHNRLKKQIVATESHKTNWTYVILIGLVWGIATATVMSLPADVQCLLAAQLCQKEVPNQWLNSTCNSELSMVVMCRPVANMEYGCSSASCHKDQAMYYGAKQAVIVCRMSMLAEWWHVALHVQQWCKHRLFVLSGLLLRQYSLENLSHLGACAYNYCWHSWTLDHDCWSWPCSNLGLMVSAP